MSSGGFCGRRTWRTPSDVTIVTVAVVSLLSSCGNSKNDSNGGQAATAGSAGSGGSAGVSGEGGAAAGSAGKGGSSAGNGGSSGAGSGGTAGAGAIGGSQPEGGNASADAGDAGAEPGGRAGDGGGDGGSSGNALSPFIRAFCQTARTCCDAAGMPPGPLSACELGFASHYDVVESIELGKVIVDQAALAACVSAYAAAEQSCDFGSVYAGCPAMFRGTVADGQRCKSAFECDRSDGPKMCLRLQNSEDPELGACQVPDRAGLDEPCGATCPLATDCSFNVSNPDAATPTAYCHEADGLFCNFGYGCARLVDDGEVCDSSAACASESVCLSTCEPLKDAGAECQFIFECAEGLTCDEGSCVVAPVASDYTCSGFAPFIE